MPRKYSIHWKITANKRAFFNILHVKALTPKSQAKSSVNGKENQHLEWVHKTPILQNLSKLKWNTISLLDMTLEYLSCDFVHCFRPK